MANKKGRRRFGNIRRLPSGRYQASYVGPDGVRRTAPDTFATKTDASVWLTVRESEVLQGDWMDPDLGRVRFADFATAWIAERKLSERTRELYESLFRLHMKEDLGGKQLREISTEVVRNWRSKLLVSGRSEITVAKAYRLLRAIMYTAVDDGRIRRNPCRIKGADKEHSPARPVASIPQVYALADAIGSRFRVLILAAAFTGLRWGELIGLRRCDVDLTGPSVRVPRRVAQLNSGRMVEGPPKSAAGFRAVALPAILVPELRWHLATYVGELADALVFVGEKGAWLKRGNWRRSVRWSEKVAAVGLPAHFHFHDLRHTGSHLAALSGATTRELMHRMGHGSVRAALIYQQMTSERDREIASRLSGLVESVRPVPASARRPLEDAGTAEVPGPPA